MTREEAMQILTETQVVYFAPKGKQKVQEAIDMAIEALSEPKTIIGIDIPYGSDKGLATLFKGKDDKLILEEVKEIMSVVRCKDCKHRIHDEDRRLYYCEMYYGQGSVLDENYCQWGEREEP